MSHINRYSFAKNENNYRMPHILKDLAGYKVEPLAQIYWKGKQVSIKM